jgi:2-oxoglutarate dehydrogenase E2 component (dihydrolipoamide succinyltransferase)
MGDSAPGDKTPIAIPALGVAMTEAMMLKWLKEPEDHVNEGEAVAEIETDKIDVELLSPISGILVNHLCQEGDVIPVGGVVAEVRPASGAAATEVPHGGT